MTRRDLLGEAAFLPNSLEEAADLQDYLVAAGLSQPVAAGIANWLTRKAANRPDRTNASTRARYRKVLAGIEAPAPTPDGPGRLTVVEGGQAGTVRRRRGSGGKLASVALALGLAASALGGAPSAPSSRTVPGAVSTDHGAKTDEFCQAARRRRRRRAA
jgi:hypothetical protein